MTLLFPLGLAALAGVLLPLVLHLARRTEQRPTDFAALRWLRQKPRPRHRPRFDELLLLVVRLLLVAGIALVLAQPVLTGEEDAEQVVAVVPGATVPPPGNARQVWLAPGFPAIDTAPPAGPQPIASLIRQLDAELPAKAPLTIVVPRILAGADAERPRVSRPVTWRVAGEGGAASPARAASAPALRSDAARPGTRYVAAAIRALGGTDIGDATAAIRNRPLVWLVSGALPGRITDHVERGGIVLVASDTVITAAATIPVWHDAAGAALVEAQRFGRGRLLRFTRPLTPASMPVLLEADFPRRLAALFAGAPEPTRVLATAYTPEPGAPSPSPPARPLWQWLAVAVAGLFSIERWLATSARRASTP